MSIECLKCENEVVKFELPDHIAAHFNYFPHLCNDCYYSCYSSQKAVEHEVMSNHSVLQNKAKNIYMHNLCLGIYKDCLLAKKYGHKYVLLYGLPI
uniref:C2H2-type domain-containing protein n=1 Tax=Ditylenchus dipsaci TaxID=166011 RepID=A0A915ECG1_9BILA